MPCHVNIRHCMDSLTINTICLPWPVNGSSQALSAALSNAVTLTLTFHPFPHPNTPSRSYCLYSRQGRRPAGPDTGPRWGQGHDLDLYMGQSKWCRMPEHLLLLRFLYRDVSRSVIGREWGWLILCPLWRCYWLACLDFLLPCII